MTARLVNNLNDNAPNHVQGSTAKNPFTKDFFNPDENKIDPNFGKDVFKGGVIPQSTLYANAAAILGDHFDQFITVSPKNPLQHIKWTL